MVDVEQAAGVLAQLGVALHRNFRRLDLVAKAQQVGDAAHQLSIADAPEEAAANRLASGEIIAAERRLPDLHRVDTGRLASFGGENHHAPVFQARITVAEDRVV